ncbi:hypothetical protein EDC04DRAFT_2503746, partial [Pisolithus marmoratus]
IFIGELSWNVDNDWLAQEFSSCGGVESATIQMDRITGRSHRFGYVHFKSMDAVEKVLAMDGKEIDGRAIRANRRSDRGGHGGHGSDQGWGGRGGRGGCGG